MKGSLYVTRPALADYIADKDERAALAGELFDHVGAGRIQRGDQPALRPRRRRPGPPRPRVRTQHRLVGLRPGVGRLGRRLTHRHQRQDTQEITMTDTIDRIPVHETDAPRRLERHRGPPAHHLHRRRAAQRQPRRRRQRPGRLREIKDLLLQHKVLFFRDQPISRADHVRLAERFGPLEDHPVAGSDPEHPGLVRIYKDLDSPAEQYENAFHCDATWREAPPMGSVLRCVEGSGRRRRHDLGRHGPGVQAPARAHQGPDRRPAPGTASRRPSAPRCRSRSASRSRRVPRRGAPGRAHPPETGEKVLFVNAFDPLHQLPHAKNVRYGFDYTPAAASCSTT